MNEVNFIIKLEGYSEGGATFTPTVSEEGILSWENDMGLENPEPVNIKGDPGKDGIDGEDGYTPQKGIDYFDGKDGEDGYTPVKGVDYFDGKDGVDGEDGYTPVKGVDYFDGKDGEDGEDGYTPQRGVDYWTAEDVAEINAYIDEYIGTNVAAYLDEVNGEVV